jgi:hypothetical protein
MHSMVDNRAALIYSFIVLLMTLFAAKLAYTGSEGLVSDGVNISLVAAGTVAEQQARLAEDSVSASAQFAASGTALVSAMNLEQYVPVAAPAGEDGAAPPVDSKNSPEYRRHISVVEKLSVQSLKLGDMKKRRPERAQERGMYQRGNGKADVFMVVDEKGIGVAAVGKDLLSWFDGDVGKIQPSIMDVAKTGKPRVEYWNWGFNAEDKRLHVVALAPIRANEGEKPVGVVVVGEMVNSGTAKNMKEAAGGIADVALFRGNQILGSTFGTNEQRVVGQQLAGFEGTAPDDTSDFQIGEAHYRGLSRTFPRTTADGTIGVLVTRNVTEAVQPSQMHLFKLLSLGLFALFLGGGILLWLGRKYLAPIEKLDTGLQDVIAGNMDYVWEFSPSHKLQNGLAQRLNLMSAFLQGKPMPDEAEDGGGWDDFEMDGAGGKSAGAPKIQGVAIPGMAPRPKKADPEG